MSLWPRKKKYRPALWTTLPRYAKRCSRSKLPRARLRPISARQSARLSIYAVRKRAYLKRHPICKVCLTRKSTDVHHVKGRGPYLLTERWFMALCRTCHQDIHDNPKAAFAKGYLVSRLAKSQRPERKPSTT